jgi:hypothetical protein
MEARGLKTCWFKLVPITEKEGQELLTCDYDAERAIKFNGWADDVCAAVNAHDELVGFLKEEIAKMEADLDRYPGPRGITPATAHLKRMKQLLAKAGHVGPEHVDGCETCNPQLSEDEK